MKYLFQALMLAYFIAAFTNSNQMTNPAGRCNVNNYYTFSAGPNCKKIENVMSEVKQQLAELKQQIMEMAENQTEGPTGKAYNCSYSFAEANYTKKIEKMFSEVKQQLVELKEEIKQMKGNQTGGPCIKVYKNCAEVYKSGHNFSGVYKIDPDGLGEFEVFCDHKTAGGGWTVFQKRMDGSVDFYRAWDDYKRGFGNLTGEFWLGLDKIHRLTVNSSKKLRVDLEDNHNATAFAEYSSFSVASENAKYQLSLGSYTGTAGDSLSYHRGAPFSTKDRDNDADSGNCASYFKGAWWYRYCHQSNLNGLYLNGKVDDKGMMWYHWKNSALSVKRSEMKIRPKDF